MDADEAEKRTLFVTKRIGSFIHGTHTKRATADYYSRIRAALGEFVKGEPLYDDEAVLKKLVPHSHNIWEFRITFQPQARIVGAVAKTDVFVAIEPEFRDMLEKKGFDEIIGKSLAWWQEWLDPKPRDPCHPLTFCFCNVKD